MATDISNSWEALVQRVADLEREFAVLRKESADKAKTGGIFSVIGSFAGDPDYAEILRLGREYRASLDADADK